MADAEYEEEAARPKRPFRLPDIQENVNGWGPCAAHQQFSKPYQPFSKTDRLGKISDWTGATYQDRRYMHKYQSQYGAGGTLFSYTHEEDESSFHLVDTSRVQRPPYQRNRARFQQRNNLRRERERREERTMQTLSKQQKGRDRDRLRMQRRWQKQYGSRRWNDHSRSQTKQRQASVEVQPDWKCVEEIEFSRLGVLHLNVEPPTDLRTCGSMEFYDKSYDRVTTKNERPLKGVNRIFHKVTTTDDPVIRELSAEGNVFATDAILACLMSCSRSVYSWDIIVQRVGDKLFFDKRDNSQFDLLTVSETAVEPPQEEGTSINAPATLALEATFINQNLSQQVLTRGKAVQFEHPNPFVTEEDYAEVASVGYRYRRWQLGEDLVLIARCEHDAVMAGKPGSPEQFINIKALNEWNPKASGVDWRQKLDKQRGAVLATELKNNSAKLAKWTLCSLLAGSDAIKFGYVSRTSAVDSSKHVILGTQQFKPQEFAAQITLDMSNCWGVLRAIIDICMRLEGGKYLILKDPNKPVMRIYSVPSDAFESDDDDDDEDEDDEEA